MGRPLVSIVMGSSNDWEIMQQAAQQLKDFGVAYDARVISAHRSPKQEAGGANCSDYAARSSLEARL